MTEILTDFSEQALIAAIEGNLLGMMPDVFASLPGASYHDAPDIAWFATGISHPLFNGVLRTQIPSDAPARIKRIKSYFQSERLPMIWWVVPSAQPDHLGQLLQAHGLIHFEDSEGMAVDLHTLEDQPTRPNLQVQKVDSIELMEEWIQPFVKVFELPEETIEPVLTIFGKLGLGQDSQWHHYVGTLDGKVVGSSSMYLGVGVAGIYNVSTLPKARKQGVGTALTLAPLLDARQMGYRIGILQASEMGLSIYQRLGFKEYCKISHYVYLPSWIQRTMLRVYAWMQRYKSAFSRKRG